MAKFDYLKDGEIGLIMQENGRIVQLGLTKEIHKAITFMIAQLSQQNPLVKMPEEHDLVLKSTVKTFKK